MSIRRSATLSLNPECDRKSTVIGLLQGPLIFSFALIVAVSSLHAGPIFGEVKFTDSPPKLSPVRAIKDQDYCGETIPNESYLIDANGGLKNVVVSIESALAGKAANPQKENILYNDGCRYTPRVLAMQLGERPTVKSNDP